MEPQSREQMPKKKSVHKTERYEQGKEEILIRTRQGRDIKVSA